jgi:hypothetical protein
LIIIIKKIYSEGEPKDNYTKVEVDNHLKELEKHNLEFVVGIDYASLSSKDYTTVSHFFENEKGVLTFAGSKLI